MSPMVIPFQFNKPDYYPLYLGFSFLLLDEHVAEEGYESMDLNPAIAGYSAAIHEGLDENPDYF